MFLPLVPAKFLLYLLSLKGLWFPLSIDWLIRWFGKSFSCQGCFSEDLFCVKKSLNFHFLATFTSVSTQIVCIFLTFMSPSQSLLGLDQWFPVEKAHFIVSPTFSDASSGVNRTQDYLSVLSEPGLLLVFHSCRLFSLMPLLPQCFTQLCTVLHWLICD